LLKGYRVHDYKGLWIRQGFVESRLFGILASPNYLSLISLIVIIFLFFNMNNLGKRYKQLSIVAIVLNFIYIVLSGSRTTYICLVVAAFLYSLIKFEYSNKAKSFVTVLLTVGLVFLSYNGVKYSSDLYLKAHSAEIQLNKEKGENNNLTLERTDTSEENIS